jgi:hypothetical protein
MKLPTPFIIVTIFILVALGLTNLPLYREKVRPIKVLVIDGFNSKPVENAIVYYCLKTVRVKNILGIPMIAPFDYRDVVRKQFYTDKNGCIYLPQQKVYFKLYEKVFREYIYINLDLIEKTGKKEEYFKAPKGSILNPINRLKGAIIESTKKELAQGDYPPELKTDIFEHIINEKSLLKKYDELVILLEEHE